jgi:hypothetical protein
MHRTTNKEHEMTTYPTNGNQGWSRMQPTQWQSPSTEAPTMAAAAYFPPPQAYAQPYVPAYAWSAEQPEFNSTPLAYTARQPWYARPRVLAFAGAGFVAAAAAGLFAALHGSSASAPVNMANHSTPAPATAPAPAPAPAPMPATQPSAPSYKPSHSSTSSSSYAKAASRSAAQQTPPPAPPVQPDQSGQSDPSQWNNGGNYRWNYSGDHDGRWNFWNRDHDNRWNFFSRNHDSDNSYSSHDQSNNSNSSDSNQSEDSK